MKRVARNVMGLAVVGVLVGLGAGAYLASQVGRAVAKSDVQEDARNGVPVVVTTAKQMTFESKVVVSGNVQAKNWALVSARMPGPLDAVFVDEGDVVEAGKTQLFQTDSIKLAKAVALARQELTVAECSVREKQANLEQTLSQNEQAAKDLERYRELSRQKAISAQLFEQQGSQVRQAEAMVKHKQALVALAIAQQEQANLSLMIAEKDMADSLVVAPISGRISERKKEPGEMAGAGTPVVMIADLSVLEISVHIPEEFYGRVKPGQTQMRVNVGGTDLGVYRVSRKSPTVYSKLRTFEVQGIIESPPEGVVPGCMAEVSIVLDERPGVGIPTSAIQQRGDQQVAFVVDGGKARMVSVKAGRESQGWTEVTATDLPAGTPVVTMGQTLVEDGSDLTIVKEGLEVILSDFSVRRPVAMSCLIIAFTLLGMNSYRKMGLELMPKMDAPFVSVITIYPGASPEELETDVAKRIEDAVVSIDGLKHVSSTCMENVCQTFMEFQMDVDVDVAATDVREKLDLVRSEFPTDVEDPMIQKFDINATPIVNLALTGEVPLDELYDYADNTLSDRLTVISGVAQVELIGGAEREVHVELDREKLAARSLSSMNVVQAIQNAVRTIPSGRVRDRGAEYSVKFDADYDNVADLADLEIDNDEGRRCHIRDVGQVRMSTEELRQQATIDGRPCIAIKVVKKADANAVKVANAVRAAMSELNAELPGGMELVWVDDDGRFIEANNQSAWINVFQGILLTAAILFLFLYNIRALFVIAISMPLTIIIGLFFMQAVGYSLNTSTLIAIGMSVGILVTNSIVVLEAIDKRLSETGNPKEASRLGAAEAFIAVLASAGTNVVVLFPLSVMSNKIGMFIGPLAMTMFIMTVVSLFISFTLTPMLCSLLLKPRQEGSRSLLARMERGWNWAFDRVVRGYRWGLEFSEHHRWAAALVLLAVIGMLIHSFRVAGTLGSSAFSETDMGRVYLRMEFPTRSSLDETVRRVQQAEARMRDLPELKHILTTVGKVEAILGQSSEGVYLAQILMKFSERDQRELTMVELKEMVRDRIAGYPGAILGVSQPSLIGGQSNPVELEIAGSDLQTLDSLATKTLGFARGIPGFRDPDTTVRPGKPEIRIEPRRAVLSDLKAPAIGLGLALRANLEGIEAGTFKQNARNYDIVVKLDEQQGKEQVGNFLFPGTDGHALLLANLGKVSESEIPIQITRKNKRRITKLTSQLDHSLPLGTAVEKLGAEIDKKGELPPGYDYTFAGEYEMMNEAQQGLAEAGIMSIILVILTLAAILESFRQPALILVTVPLALIGTFWALALGGESISIFVIMGIVMMIGIVVNNAILIMDQFNTHVREGVPRHKAMITASCERFRPIVMITLAAVLGMMPLALGRGIGAEMRNGVGIASAGGILVSGVLTLLVVPILYDLFTRGKRGATPTP